MVTITDVARAAGVSTATVSRALSGPAAVSDGTRARVLASVQALGYRPNAIARSLRTDSTQTLGLVISDVLNPFFTELARAVEDEARRLGYSLILGNADEDVARQDTYIELLLNRRVDGLLVTPAVEESPMVGAAVRRGTPVVFIDRAADGVAAPVVRADGSRATAELVAHLVRLGHRRIAIIAGPERTLTGRERLAAFRAALREHRVALPRGYVRHGDFRLASGVRCAERLLDMADPPSAIFAADNLMALGALQAIRRRGARIPDDVALASFDDLAWFEVIEPPLTAIAQPTARIGATAVQQLVELASGRPARSQTFECRLIVRASCGEASPRQAGTVDDKSASTDKESTHENI